MTTTYRPAPRGPAPRPADVGVRFAKTLPAIWEGNGFGTATAHWVALMGDTEVGSHEGRVAVVFGSRSTGMSVTRWREAIAREAAKGL